MSLLDPKATLLSLSIPKGWTRNQRIELADLVIEHIYDRTNAGNDVTGKPFKNKYSKGYENSLAGRVGGKKEGGTPNLQLSGDMLAAMTLVEQQRGKVVIGWDDQDERAKAEGNILGSYGQPDANPKKARPFFGIKASKLRELIDAVR